MRKMAVVAFSGLLGLVLVGLAVAGANRNYSVHASGDLELPLRETDAQGQAIFHLAKDGESIEYKLIVANIENVFQAHIHMAASTANGPIVVWLYPSTAPVPVPLDQAQGRIEGVIAEGTITAANLVGPLAGHDLDDLLAALDSGNAYVNAHTNDNVAPTNTGPGDFPGGEIRGNFG
jgi:hypothetical protein